MFPISPKEAGEIGKRIAQEMIGITLHLHGPDGEKDGKFYEIKTRVMGRTGRKSKSLSSYRLMGLKDNFDFLVIVALNEEGKLLKLVLVERSIIKDLKNARLSLINNNRADLKFQAKDWDDYF